MFHFGTCYNVALGITLHLNIILVKVAVSLLLNINILLICQDLSCFWAFAPHLVNTFTCRPSVTVRSSVSVRIMVIHRDTVRFVVRVRVRVHVCLPQ